jgi:hypothetical protein
VKLAVFSRCHPKKPRESAAKRVSICEAAKRRYLLRGAFSAFQHLTGSRDTGYLDPVRRRYTDLISKKPREMARTQAGPFCKPRDAMIGARFGGNPPLHLLKR